MSKKSILLNCLPPTMENMAAPALSVLKPQLMLAGYNVDIEYWNLKLNPSLRNFLNFNDLIYETEHYKLLPFYAYLAVENQDSAAIDKLIYTILTVKPQLHVKGAEFIKNEFVRFHSELNTTINQYLDTVDISQYLYIGFSSLFYQWIIATIFAKCIKSRYPDVKVLVGGWGTKTEAESFMRNFPVIDFASWGEGEESLIALSDCLSKGTVSLDDIPHTIYRNNSQLQCSNKRSKYVNLDVTQFDISDFINNKHQIPAELPLIVPIEGGRGCHWKKCHFCFLNSGYKTRVKSIKSISNEIRYCLDNYNINSFLFLDNDIIGADLNRYNDLLDELIAIRDDYNEFSIAGAEIISKDITYDIIKKMGIIHFESVQVGYESPSNNLLKKIEKKNTFASNLFFIKWARHFGIKVNGANVLRNLLEETPEDIKESIDNLRSLRFYLDPNMFKHNHSDLGIAQSSRYFKELKRDNRLHEWSESSIYDLLPKGFTCEEDKYILFLNFIKKEHNSLWDLFKVVEEHYVGNMYDYKLYKDGQKIYFREIYNGLIINELEFEENDVFWEVIKLCNKEVLSKDQLATHLNLSTERVTEVLTLLANEALVYTNDDYSEIVTIINTDLIC